MPYELSVNHEEQYIRFDLSGTLSQVEINKAMSATQAIREEMNLRCILCDQRQLDTPPSDIVGFLTAEQFGTPPYLGMRLAIIRRDASRERLFDIAAANRGVEIKVFEDEEEAKGWLLGG
jgi:hypothetical protein